jgi:hypothetical protein
MARAAIQLFSDISPYLPFLSQQIEGLAYNSEFSQAAFRRDDMAVVIYPKEINIYQIENETAARNVIVWLKEMIDHIKLTS